jgi:hypothetical protein
MGENTTTFEIHDRPTRTFASGTVGEAITSSTGTPLAACPLSGVEVLFDYLAGKRKDRRDALYLL